jgi:hypothetical protein
VIEAQVVDRLGEAASHAASQRTLEIHGSSRAFAEIPVLRQLSTAAGAIQSRRESMDTTVPGIDGQTNQVALERATTQPSPKKSFYEDHKVEFV